MKKLLIIMLLLLINVVAIAQNPFRLHVSGNGSWSEAIVKDADIESLENVCDSLIREGYTPTVFNIKNDVVWIYLNDTTYPTDFDNGEEVDYGEPILDLFPIKLDKTLKREYKKGNSTFLKYIGVQYTVENGEVISIIDYKKFIKVI